jgi:predicted  nucleic acid-binding Zn-ribbon protein
MTSIDVGAERINMSEQGYMGEQSDLAHVHGGRPTVEAHILVCRDCGNTVFVEHKLTKNAVVRKCSDCGSRVSVQGSVALARVASTEAAFARMERRIDPDPEAGRKRKASASADDGESDTEQVEGVETKEVEDPWGYLRFAIPGQRMAEVDRILETYRVQYLGNKEMRGQRWQGIALCNMLVEWASGAEMWAMRIVDTVRQTVALEAARVESEEGRKLPTRRATRLAVSVRDKLLEGLGKMPGGEDEDPEALPTEQFEEAARVNVERAVEKAEQAEAEAADERVFDDGALLDAMRMARDDLPDYQRHLMHVGGPEKLKEFMAMHERSGGFLLRVRGDERTKTKGGARPEGYLWLAEDLSEQLDLGVAYDDIVDDAFPQPDLEVVELVPADYGTTPDDAWEMPPMARARERMEL